MTTPLPDSFPSAASLTTSSAGPTSAKFAPAEPAPRMRSAQAPASLGIVQENARLPDQYAHAMVSLTQDIHQLRPSLTQGFGLLMSLCETLKAQEGMLKAVLTEYPESKKTEQLRTALAALLHDLDRVLATAEPDSASSFDKLNLDPLRKLCHGLAVCIPDDGDALIDAGDRAIRRAAQRITDTVLKRAAALGFPAATGDVSEALDILNWISRGLATGLLSASDEVVECLKKAVDRVAGWTESEQGRELPGSHNIGRCARQLSTVLRFTRICEPATDDDTRSDATRSLRSAIINLCSAPVLDRLMQAPPHIVSLQNICTLLKDALDREQIAADEAALDPALARIASLIDNLNIDQLLPAKPSTGPLTRDCRPLATFCNLMRELGERRSVRAGQFAAPPAWLQRACQTLVDAIGSKDFRVARTSPVQLVNLLSFIKLVDKLIARNPDKQKANAVADKARQSLDEARAKVIGRLLRSPALSYDSPGQLIGLLSGFAHFAKHGLLKRSDALENFCASLLQQAARLGTEAWDERAMHLLPLTLRKSVEQGIVTSAAAKSLLATLQQTTGASPPSSDTVNPLPPNREENWQQAKSPVKAATVHPDARGEPRLMIRKSPDKKPEAAKPAQSPKKAAGKDKRQAGKPTVTRSPAGPAHALATGDAKALTEMLSKQPQIDIAQLLDQSLAAVEGMNEHVRTAFDHFFSLAEKLQPDTARATLISYFSQHPPQYAGLQTLLQQRGYLESPPDLRSLQKFDDMLNFLRTASDETFRRSAALPGFGRLLLTRDGARNTLLHKAVELNDIRSVDRLLSLKEAKSLLLTKNKSGQLPLHQAIALADTTIAVRLLSDGSGEAQALTPDRNGSLPVVLAIAQKADAIVDRLLSLNNAHKQAETMETQAGSPLHAAAFHNHAFAAAKLLSLNMKPSQTLVINRNGYTPLAMAAVQGSTAVLDLLLQEKNIDDMLQRKDRLQNNVLHIAATNNHPAVVAKLLASPAALRLALETNGAGRNALMIAADAGHAKIVEQLLALPNAAEMLRQTNAGAGGNARDIAAKEGKTEIVRMLDRFMQKAGPDQ